MAPVHGKGTAVLMDEFNLSSYFRGCNVGITGDTAETTTFGKSAKTYLPGQIDGTAALDGLFDGSANAIDPVIAARMGSATDVVFSVAYGGFTTGGRAIMAGGIFTSYQAQSPVGDVVSVSADFQADQGLMSGWSLHNYTALSATGNGTTVNTGSATTTYGAIGTLHVVTNGRNGTVDVKIQSAPDGSTWSDLITFTQIPGTTVGKQVAYALPGVNVQRDFRYVLTLGGSTGSVLFQVNVARFMG